MERHRAWLAKKNDKLVAQKELRVELRGGMDTDDVGENAEDPEELEEETLFVLIKEETIPLPA